MGHFQLKTSLRTITLGWNREGQLSSLSLQSEPSESDLPGLTTSIPSRVISIHGRTQGNVPAWLSGFCDQLKDYFDRGCPLQGLAWFDLDCSSWTEFQYEVYRATSSIPHGETRTYAWVARKIGKPRASRAVGQALRKNPVPLIVPCHRVVSSLGHLGGFMGEDGPESQELHLKKSLIEIEERYLNPIFPFLVGHEGA